MEKQTILITGASGLIGTRLTELLLKKGYLVNHLGRSESKNKAINSFIWDPSHGKIDMKAFNNVDHIVHLAGAGIADKRWTDGRKKEILDSRVDATELLLKVLKEEKTTLKSFIAASAIGYYGFKASDKPYVENDRSGKDFLANVTKIWEKETDEIAKLGLRTVKMRIGIVMSEKGGALPEMMNPIKWFAGAPLASGQQIISWIALDDLCNMFIYAIENEEMKGAYNAVAPNPINNETLTRVIGNAIGRPIYPLNVPRFMLKLILGEMELMVSEGASVDNFRIKTETDFEYQFTDIEACIEHLI
jgi:uncharacterized protein